MTIAAQAASPVKVPMNQVVQAPTVTVQVSPVVPAVPVALAKSPRTIQKTTIRRNAAKKAPITLPN